MDSHLRGDLHAAQPHQPINESIRLGCPVIVVAFATMTSKTCFQRFPINNKCPDFLIDILNLYTYYIQTLPEQKKIRQDFRIAGKKAFKPKYFLSQEAKKTT